MAKRITPIQYAVLLYEATKDLSLSKIDVKVSSFLNLLKKNNDLGQINRIIREFEIYDKKEKGIKEVELTSAKSVSADIKNNIIGILGQKVEIKEKVDPDLIGGMVILVGDTMVDGSLRRRLVEITKRII